jgi:hypothetical protein
MFIKELKETSHTERTSKLGKKHVCKRVKTLYLFKCDQCDNQFTRSKGQIQIKRVSNYYKHVCSGCDPKRFAQQQGVKQRQVLGMDASSDIPISKL